jgi:hypothetical protein
MRLMRCCVLLLVLLAVEVAPISARWVPRLVRAPSAAYAELQASFTSYA